MQDKMIILPLIDIRIIKKTPVSVCSKQHSTGFFFTKIVQKLKFAP